MARVARYCAKYLRAYENQVQWDVETNGEAFALAEITGLAEGDIFDAGANAGQWAAMAARVAPGRKIHSFELSPRTYERLAAGTAALPQVVANPFGLGKADGEVTFHYYPDSDDRSSIVLVPDGFAKEDATGTIRTGDGYVASAHVERIAYLKIDVEGAEMSVLRGFRGCLENGTIAAVQFEHGPAHVVTRHLLIDFVELFDGYGYEIRRLFPRRLAPLHYDPVEHENFTGANFLAVRKDIAAKLP